MLQPAQTKLRTTIKATLRAMPRRELILAILLIWLPIAVIPTTSPWPSIPPKQLALVAGATILLACSFCSERWNPLLAWQRARKTARLALGAAIGWVLWQALILANMARVDQYEGFWGNSSRGSGFSSRMAITALLLVVATSPHICGDRWIPTVTRFAGTLVAIQATLQAFGLDLIKWDITPLYIGTFGNLNQASSFYAIATVLLGALVISRERITHRDFTFYFDGVLFTWLLALCVRTAARAGSRQGVFLVTTVIGIACLSYLIRETLASNGRRRTTLWLLALGTLSASGIAITFIMRDHGALDRFAIWTTALEVVRAHPYFGVGIAQVPYHWHAFQTFRDMSSGDVFRMVDEVHNSILQQAAEAGIVSASLYVAVLASVSTLAFRGISSSTEARRMASAGWLVFAMQDVFSPFSTPISALGWCLAGTLISSDIDYELSPYSKALKGFPVNALRYAVSLSLVTILGVAIVPRIITEYKITRIWNVGSDLAADASTIRKSLEVHAVMPKLQPLVRSRGNDFELRRRAAYVAAINGEVVRAGEILKEGIAIKQNDSQMRYLYALLELTHGDPRIAVAQLDTAARISATSLQIALTFYIAAEYVRDTSAIRRALAHRDSLGARFRISADSMRSLHNRQGGGIEAAGKNFILW